MLVSFCNYLSHSSIYDRNTTVTEMHWMARTLLKVAQSRVPRSIYKILNESVDYSIVSNSLLQLEETILNQFQKKRNITKC